MFGFSPSYSGHTRKRVHYCCRQSEVMSKISFTRRCVHGCIKETTFQHSLYIYCLKTIRRRWNVDWKNLVDRNENQMTTLNATFHPFVGTLTTANIIRALLLNDLEFLNNARIKRQNMVFRTSKMDHIGLQYWYNNFLRPLRVDGRGFLYRNPTTKKGSLDQKSKRVSFEIPWTQVRLGSSWSALCLCLREHFQWGSCYDLQTGRICHPTP